MTNRLIDPEFNTYDVEDNQPTTLEEWVDFFQYVRCCQIRIDSSVEKAFFKFCNKKGYDSKIAKIIFNYGRGIFENTNWDTTRNVVLEAYKLLKLNKIIIRTKAKFLQNWVSSIKQLNPDAKINTIVEYYTKTTNTSNVKISKTPLENQEYYLYIAGDQHSISSFARNKKGVGIILDTIYGNLFEDVYPVLYLVNSNFSDIDNYGAVSFKLHTNDKLLSNPTKTDLNNSGLLIN